MQCYTFVGSVKKRKGAYPSKKDAKIALGKAAKRFGFDKDEYEVYRCGQCRQYHYGRKRREQQPRKGAPSYA